MLRHALICIAAFIFICERSKIQAINFKQMSPLSSNFLQKVSDFDDVVEPQFNQDSPFSVVKTRESISEAEEEESINNDDTIEKCPHCTGNTPDSEKRLMDKVKRELDQVGTIFFNQFLGKGKDIEERPKRSSTKGVKKDENEKEETEDYVVDCKTAPDTDFEEEQSKAENLTKSIKVLFNEIEHPPLTEVAGEGLDCVIEENTETEKVPVHDLKKSKSKGGKSLKIHYYKPTQNTKKMKMSLDNDKALLINLYPEEYNSKVLRTPEKYDYIALLSKGNRLVKVPAIKLMFVPEENEEKRSCENFEPFYISKYIKQPQHRRFQPTKNLFHLINYEGLNHHWTHIPILFVNTIPDVRTPNSYKRSNYGVPENSYLRDVDLLIQKVNTSLKMGLLDRKQTELADAGILVNPRFENRNLYLRPRVKSYIRRKFKPKINQEYPFAEEKYYDRGNSYRWRSFDSDFPSPLVGREYLREDDFEPSRSMGVASDKDELDFLEFTPNKFSNFGRNKGSSMKIISEEDGSLLKNKVNSAVGTSSKLDKDVSDS